MVSRSNSDPLISVLYPKGFHIRRWRNLGVRGTVWATARPAASHDFRIQVAVSSVPRWSTLPVIFGVLRHDYRCKPRAGFAAQLRQLCCPKHDFAKFFSITQAGESPPFDGVGVAANAGFRRDFEANAP
jgi:hypothetical protein